MSGQQRELGRKREVQKSGQKWEWEARRFVCVCEGRQMVKLCKQQATPVRQQAGTTDGTVDGLQ